MTKASCVYLITLYMLVMMLTCFAIDKQVSFELVQSTSMSGVLKACDTKLLQFHVEQLGTPSGIHDEVTLRTADIVSCSVCI